MSSYRIYLTSLFLFFLITLHAQEACKHTVKRGETFASIANKYGITEQQLKTANSKYKTCYVGLMLSIPQSSKSKVRTDLNVSKTENTPVKKDNKNESVKSSANIVHTTPKPEADNAKSETAHVADIKNKNKKGKKSFWKSVGQIASTFGDVVVAVADGMNSSGLMEKTGATGELIGSTADLVNSVKGEESNYYNGGDNKYTSTASYNSSNTLQLQKRLTEINKRQEVLAQQLITLHKNKDKTSDAMRHAVTQHNNKVNRNVALTAGNYSLAKIKSQTQYAAAPYQKKLAQNDAQIKKLQAEYKKLTEEKLRIEKQLNSIDENETIDEKPKSDKASNGVKIYQDSYDRFAKNAKSTYEEMTIGGSRVKKEGNIHGTTSRNMTFTTYSGYKRVLKSTQREMRKTRQKAKSRGYDIEQSKYETIDVEWGGSM